MSSCFFFLLVIHYTTIGKSELRIFCRNFLRLIRVSSGFGSVVSVYFWHAKVIVVFFSSSLASQEPSSQSGALVFFLCDDRSRHRNTLLCYIIAKYDPARIRNAWLLPDDHLDQPLLSQRYRNHTDGYRTRFLFENSVGHLLSTRDIDTPDCPEDESDEDDKCDFHKLFPFIKYWLEISPTRKAIHLCHENGRSKYYFVYHDSFWHDA